MPDTDILSQLLPTLMNQGQAPDNSGEMGALAAFQNSPFLQGQPSHSGPMGQISQAIMPLIAAKIYEKQGQQDHQAKTLEHLTEIIKLSNAIDDRKLKQLKLEAAKNPGGEIAKVIPVIEALKSQGLTGSAKVGGLTIGTGSGNKLPTSEIGLMERAQPNANPADILKQYQSRQDQRADEASLRTTQRAQLLQEQAGERREQAARAKPAPKTRVYFDKTTGQRIQSPNMGQVNDNDYADVTPNEAFAIGEVKSALKQLGELDGVIENVLPDYDKTANTLSGIISAGKGAASVTERRLKRDPEIRRFDALRKINKIPAIAAMSRTGKMPVIDTKILEGLEIGDTDTKEGAREYIKTVKDLLYGFANNVGLDASVLEKSGQGQDPAMPAPLRNAMASHPTGPSKIELDPQLRDRGAFEKIQQQHPKWTADEMATYYLNSLK